MQQQKKPKNDNVKMMMNNTTMKMKNSIWMEEPMAQSTNCAMSFTDHRKLCFERVMQNSEFDKQNPRKITARQQANGIHLLNKIEGCKVSVATLAARI